MRKIWSVALASVLATTLWGNDDLDALLGEYAQKADLSEQTRRESAGFLQVYTRQDLERMQIHQLKELLEKIPFFRYTEDQYGLTYPFYLPGQPPVPNGVRVYINDRAISGVFTNDGLRVFGQMDMTFIDHAEIYLGIPSQTFGVEGAIYVIKLYTKDPKRENTTLLGALLGSRGTNEVYGYTATGEEDWAYQLFANYTDLKRQDVYAPNGNTLKRNKEYTTAYAEWRKGKHRFEFQALNGKVDAFMGESMDLQSKDPRFDFYYYYGGWYYKDEDQKVNAFVNLSFSQSDYDDKSKPPYALGFVLNGNPPTATPYYQDHSQIQESIVDAQFKKGWQVGKWKNETGLQVRLKHFNLAHTPNPQPENGYDTRLVFSAFSENSYLFNPNHMLVGSIKLDRNIENGNIRDTSLFTGRLGYIYNNGRWISKNFLMYAETVPVMRTYYLNRYKFFHDSDPDKEWGIAAATKLIYRMPTYECSVLASRMYMFDSVFLQSGAQGVPFYVNLNDHVSINSFMVEGLYRFSPLSKLSFQAWESINVYRNGMPSAKNFALSTAWHATLQAWDIYADIIYKRFKEVSDRGVDLNLALTYRYSRTLSFFFKANNILGRALKEDYVVFNPLSGTKTELNGVDVLDRRAWIGVEYQF